MFGGVWGHLSFILSLGKFCNFIIVTFVSVIEFYIFLKTFNIILTLEAVLFRIKILNMYCYYMGGLQLSCNMLVEIKGQFYGVGFHLLFSCGF